MLLEGLVKPLQQSQSVEFRASVTSRMETTMSYDDKIRQAREIVGDEDVFKRFLENLHKAGGTTEVTLKLCKWEDLENMGLPILIARQVAVVLRGESDENNGGPRAYVSPKKAQQMTDRDLLEAHDPRDTDTPVGRELNRRSKDKKFIVFTEDGAGVDIEVSVKLLSEIKEGYPERQSYTGEGSPRPVYRVTERPDAFGNVNPLYPRDLLRPDGTCDHTDFDWSDINMEIKQLIFLAIVSTKEIKVATVDIAYGVIELIAGNDMKKVARRYKKAAIKLAELNKIGDAPNLRKALGVRSSITNQVPQEYMKNYYTDIKNDPFYNAHKTY